MNEKTKGEGGTYVKESPTVCRTMDDLRAKAKEIGATGEMSPNCERLLALTEVLSTFDHTHHTVTEDDAILVLATARLGQNADGKNAADHVMGLIGCPQDAIKLLVRAFVSNPVLLPIFRTAIQIAERETDGIDMLSDFLMHLTHNREKR